jgi:hypothetical protein
MTDIIGRLLDEAEKAQRKGHLVLAEVCRDASDQLGLVMEERDRLRQALHLISRGNVPVEYANTGGGYRRFAAAILKETGHE